MSNPIYRFSEFSLVTGRRELLRGEKSLPVEPKVYELLLYLLENRDRAVGKDELQDAIWPNVLVTESALTRCVMKARQAVGDDSQKQEAIGTVRKGGYRFVAAVETVTPKSSQPRARPGGWQRTRIAVLPFANLGDSEDREFIAQGLSLDVSTDLSRNAWLFVVSPGSLSNYRSLDVEYAKVAADFGVQYVVEGSVRSAGGKLRISAALVDAATGATEWSERYDQQMVDLFEIQDDITQRIVASLGSQVRRAEGRKSVKADPEALDVWGLLHRGMAISWSRFNHESNLEAESLYRKALEIESENPRAKAFLATSLAMKVSNGWSDNITADSYAAWTLGNKAVEMLPDDPMVLASYGHLNTCLGQAAKAVEVLKRSIELDPSSAWSMGLLAFALTCCERPDESIEHLTNALRLSPRDAATHWYLTMLSWAYLQQKHYEDAAREAQRSINAFSQWSVPWATLGIAQAGLGQFEDAEGSFERCRSLDDRATREGYIKFFGYIVRDHTGRESINDWMQRVWPEEVNPSEN